MRGLEELGALAFAGVLPNFLYLALGLGLARLGRPTLGPRPGLGSLEQLVWAYALGTGAASLLILGLRAADLPVLGILTALATLSLVWAFRDARGREPAPTPQDPFPSRAHWLDGANVVLASSIFVAALGPETYWDGFEYHLPIAQAWTDGPIRAVPGVLDAELRAGIDLLYVPALELSQPDAAAAVTACFAAALAALVRVEVGRRAGPGAAASATFFFLIAPVVLLNAPSTYTDLAIGLYGALALFAIDAWNRRGDQRALTRAAVMIAFAANGKFSAAALVPAATLLLSLGGRVPGAGLSLRCAALALALSLPWFAKAWATSGNPLFPLFASGLGSGNATPLHLELRQLRLSTDFPIARDARGLLHYLASLNFGRNVHVSGQLGPLPLALAPLALHGLTRPAVALTGVCAVLVLGFWWAMPAVRFGSPLFPLLAVATAVGGTRLARSGRAPRGVLMALLVGVALYSLAGFASLIPPRVGSLRDPLAYEAQQFPDQDGLRRLVARANGKVAIPKGAVHWLSQPAYVLHWERNGEIFFDRLLHHHTPPDRVLAVLEGHGVTAVALDVERPLPADGGVGHPTVDAWIRAGRARRRPDPDPPRARQERIWVLIDLLPVGDRAVGPAPATV